MKRSKKYCGIFLLTIILQLVFAKMFAQRACPDFQVRDDAKFIEYLIATEQFSDADKVIEKDLGSTICSNTLLDSVNYWGGWSLYSQKKLSKSALLLGKVKRGSPFYNKSFFYAAYDHSYLSNTDSAKSILMSAQLDSTKNIELRHFELAGIALLERDYLSFQKYQSTFSYNFFELTSEERTLDGIYNEHKIFNPKSVVKAGLLSAIIPGAGKMYAGKLGEGVSALFANIILASITVENYERAGLTNYKTILFGSAFAVFYLGNVYGSMVSVKVYRNEFYKAYDRKILFNLHVPLRNIFN
jgi:hypothetical protein